MNNSDIPGNEQEVNPNSTLNGNGNGASLNGGGSHAYDIPDGVRTDIPVVDDTCHELSEMHVAGEFAARYVDTLR